MATDVSSSLERLKDIWSKNKSAASSLESSALESSALESSAPRLRIWRCSRSLDYFVHRYVTAPFRGRLILLSSALVGLALATSVAPAVGASISPTKTLASTLAITRSKTSLHFVMITKFGDTTVQSQGDVGKNQGTEQINYLQAKKSGHATVIESKNQIYIRGDAFVLVNFMGFAATAASKYANAWIAIPEKDADYATEAQGLTLSSQITEFTVPPPLKMVANTKIDGLQVLGIEGTPKSSSGQSETEVLYVHASNPPLPVEVTVRAGSITSTISYSKWNETVHADVPAHAIAISKTGLE